MPELGKYAGAVFGSWAITLALLAVLIVLTWVQAARAKRKHDEIEARRQAGQGAGQGHGQGAGKEAGKGAGEAAK